MLSRAKVEAVFFTTSASSNGPTLQAPTRLNGEQVHRVAITSQRGLNLLARAEICQTRIVGDGVAAA